MSVLDLHIWDAPGPYVVAFTTREGGVSDGPYSSLNLGRLTADDPALVDQNRRLLCEAVGADPQRLRYQWQTHSSIVRATADARQGEKGDGLWSAVRGESMLVLTADCAPLVLVRAAHAEGDSAPAIAVVHVGWRGLQAGIVENAVGALGEGQTVAAAIGPAIGPCCYEVGDEVSGPLEDRFGAGLTRGRMLDLPGAIERALAAAGVERVDRVGGDCTACEPWRYFSHRWDGGLTGRQGAIGFVA